MSNIYDQDYSGFDWTDFHLSESGYSLVSEQESTANQPHLFGTTNNAAAVSDAVGVSELTPPNQRGNYRLLGDVTTRPIQHKAILRVPQAAIDSSETADLKGKSVSVADDQDSKLDRKRRNDRAYRQRCKENKRKTDEELEALRRQNAMLQKKLQKLEHKSDGDHQQNTSEQYCKMEFHLDCYDYEARAEAMKLVGGVTGMERICMNIKENKLTLHGKDIDTLLLQTELKKICNAHLISLSIQAKMDDEKNEEKKINNTEILSKLEFQHSVPMSCSTSYSYPFPHIASAYPHIGGPPEKSLDLTKAAIFFLFFLVFVLGLACCVLYFW